VAGACRTRSATPLVAFGPAVGSGCGARGRLDGGPALGLAVLLSVRAGDRAGRPRPRLRTAGGACRGRTVRPGRARSAPALVERAIELQLALPPRAHLLIAGGAPFAFAAAHFATEF